MEPSVRGRAQRETWQARARFRNCNSKLVHKLCLATSLLLLDVGPPRACLAFVQLPVQVPTLPRSSTTTILKLHYGHQSRTDRRGVLRIIAQDDSLDLYSDRFAGIGRLYGPGSGERLRESHVCVVGLGGVGSWVVEALARSGVGRLTIVDADDVCVSNTNRQLCALTDTVGRMKASVMAERATNINPECQVATIEQFATRHTVLELLDRTDVKFDYVVDAIDGVDDKAALLTACVQLSLPVVTCGGAGGLTDPTLLMREDLTRSNHDTLLFKVRKKMRQRYGFPRGKPNKPTGLPEWNIPAIYSSEAINQPSLQNGGDDSSSDIETSSFRACDVSFGTSAVVTGTFGLAAAGLVIQQLASGSQRPPTVECLREAKEGHGLGTGQPASIFVE